jgi:hypothetical protein
LHGKEADCRYEKNDECENAAQAPSGVRTSDHDRSPVLVAGNIIVKWLCTPFA